MNEIVSIIIPIYKTEKYLNRCIDSVLNQTYTDLQIILVDDGSPDSCPCICDEYVKKDQRCCVIHKANRGVSSARNAGLDIATGKYVCFVDSDDFLPIDSVSILYEAIHDKNVQYVAGLSSNHLSKNTLTKNSSSHIIDIRNNSKEFMRYITMPGSYSPYAKIYDLEIFQKNHIRFDQNLKCSEDALMIRQYFQYCNQIALISNIVYQYNSNNEHSLSKKAYPEFSYYYSKKMEALNKLTEVLNIPSNEKEQFLTQRAVHGLKISINHYFRHWQAENDRKMLFEKTIDLLREWLFRSDVDNSFYLSKWWNKNKKYCATEPEKFFSLIERQYKIETNVARVKESIKKALNIKR